MLLPSFLLVISVVSGSHYRGGSISYTIRPIPVGINSSSEIPVRVTQRHSWRRSAHYCNDTSFTTGNIIGENQLKMNPHVNLFSMKIPSIDSKVQCTDYSEEFDYSSGENSTTVLLPVESRIEYLYEGCCWIPLLPPDSASNWSLKFIVNTKRRANGTLNNSPKTAMNPIVQVEVNKMHHIRIPMGDSDGDPIRCRWGNTTNECGSICAPKGRLTSDPCELIYNASALGYHAVALVIEDFDSNNKVLSAIPLQFLLHIVNETTIEPEICSELPFYVGDWPGDSCIGVQSNKTMQTRIQIRIPCRNTSTTLTNILTISPAGLEKSEITRDEFDRELYTMFIEWTPTSDQYGIQQLCVTPVDSHSRTGSQVCLTFQVDVLPPQFTHLLPSGLVSVNQSIWTITTDRDIVRPRRTTGIYIRFFKSLTNQLVNQIDVANEITVLYEPRQIVFFTTGFTWEQGEEYYILLDSGVAIINESCGIESVSMNDRHSWVFRVETSESTGVEEIITTETLIETTTTRQMNLTTRTTSGPRPVCPRWVSFETVSNESTNENKSQLVFCFEVKSEFADVTIAANTWVSCITWKVSGAADPLIDLYSWPDNQLLAENDDGNSLAFNNCYAAVLSYRLAKGNYRVIIRHPKCAFGRFQLKLLAEIDRALK